MQLYDEYQEPLAYTEQGSPDFSWTHRVFFAAYNAMKNRGGSIDSASMTPTWLRAIDSYTDVGWHKIFIPIGPWRYGASSQRPLLFSHRSLPSPSCTQLTIANACWRKCCARTV